jgi:eukaryotic-like serine/threonine-protein kinase
MTPDRWRLVTDIFHGALGRDAGGREVYLHHACQHDATLRAEVEALLSGHEEAGDFGERPLTLQGRANGLLEPGTFIGPYRVEAFIGAGGMGVVYRAKDPKLRRTVALKLLTVGAWANGEQRLRFIMEARAASALNHPNIVAIYDIGQSAGREFIAMEYVPGVPLHGVIPPGGLPMDRALEIALQIVGAMSAAHSIGLIHHDLKPANVLLMPDGHVKIIDFGLASIVDRTAAEGTTASLAATMEPFVAGTPGYAAPEQLDGSLVDPRADVFAIGAVIYEMLSGVSAFQASSMAGRLAAVLRSTPPPLGGLRSGIPRGLDRIVMRCLEKPAERRYPSAVELLADLSAAQAQLAARRLRLAVVLRRPAVVLTVIALLGLVALSGALIWRHQSRLNWARTVALPEAERLVQQGRNYAALRVLREVEDYTPADPVLQDLLTESTNTASVRSNPVGASVFIRDFFDPPEQWEFIGFTPLEAIRLPAGTVAWRVSAEGFQDQHALRHTAFSPLFFQLQRSGDVYQNMVWVSGGRYGLYSQPAVDLKDFWIDKYEVTNREFKVFIDAGGYNEASHWPNDDGIGDAWPSGETRVMFKDRTGRPGPSTWNLGVYPAGEEDYPVGGVSWYEAAAYCTWSGKQLPTIYHWYHAAHLEATTGFAAASNFVKERPGPARVGEAYAQGARGTFDMAGNVKEWVWTSSDPNRRYILGGGWDEPSYMFHDDDAQPPTARLATHGFRCARFADPLPAALTASVSRPTRDYRLETPVSDATFDVYRRMYEYEPRPLDARVESRDDTSAAWRIERISFAASYGNERIPALLFLPVSGPPPYQAVIWYPGANAHIARSPMGLAEGQRQLFLFLVRTGRAVLYPAYKGVHERYVGPLELPHVYREIVMHSAKDLSRAVDYLETREDIDARKLAYYGLSLGAGLGPIMTTVEPRFRASILLAGGLYSWGRSPELEPFNFLPRVKVPTLMINGRHDFFFPVDTAQRPMFALLGAPLKKHLQFESGHVPAEREAVFDAILEWLDQYLGPVRP